ncbi:cysteine desulfurase family protein [Jiulongibacter sp. NS-SX5]|uniref:cysteine desulfurase family protein n=1 Tax=Jiulongibacter sp. NS-SX5 TaxID=3463854 RepID=UPI00405970C6
MKKTIYFDNAATTSLHPEVLEEMMPYLTNVYGNGSSIHMMGRKAKSAVENARKKVAELLNTSPSEVFFTSGGTEANNTVINGCLNSLGVSNFITSPLEHHAVLHPLEFLEKKKALHLQLVKVDETGTVDLADLQNKLNEQPKSLVSLMHGNNELGNILDLQKVGELVKSKGGYFHSDTVQTIGKLPIDLQELKIDFLSGSGHKFHGPKGVGFLYINSNNRLNPFIHGGAQERNMRGGTENVAGIVGLAKAFELAVAKREERKSYILGIKEYFKAQIVEAIPGVTFNGASGDLENSLHHIINVSFPAHPDNQMLLFSLDIEGICVSGGSACSSGTDIGSHVLTTLNVPEERANVRFSFSVENTKEEVDEVILALKKILKK